MTRIVKPAKWPPSAANIEQSAAGVLTEIQSTDQDSLDKLATITNRAEYQVHQLAVAANALANLRTKLSSLQASGQIICVTPYQYGVGLEENGRHYLAPANAAKALAAKLTDRADANLASGTSGVAIMLMAATEQELAALLRPVLDIMPIPAWCSVLRRISADNAIMTQPAAPALPHWPASSPVAMAPLRDYLQEQGAALAQLESLAAETTLPIDRLRQLAAARAAALNASSTAIQRLKQLASQASLWACELSGSPDAMASQIKAAAPGDYSQVVTVGAVIISNEPMTFWKELLT
jgi:hypothetical protein